MEGQEVKEGKVVNLNAPKEQQQPQQPQERKKLSYEELENVAKQISEQNRMLIQKLNEQNNFNIFKRLDYLFKVVEFSVNFKQEFVDKCTDEIEQMITIPEEPETKEETAKEE